jgi:hypothetical protein
MSIICLYDNSGIMASPWVQGGVNASCYDIKNAYSQERYASGAHLNMVNFDIGGETLERCARAINRLGGGEVHLPIDTKLTPVKLVFAFVPCTDLAVSGAAHFKAKRELDPDFQHKATQRALDAVKFAEDLGAEYCIENPVSMLSTLWRKPDYTFHPYEYGGYLNADEAEHPLYPDYIAPRDAYSKKTCLWTSDGFKMPEKKPVACESYGNSRQHSKLGGRSEKTKTIRSLTPRGFARAVYLANR